MKVLFFESRTQTEQWDKVAQLLEKENDIIVEWIVCSPVVKPKIGNVHILPFPRKMDLNLIKNDNNDLLDVSNSDRIIIYYGGKSEHYNYYWDKIEQKILEISPNIVFGELANFHTHMAQRICKKNKIPFFQPSTTRYPNNRFGFYKEDIPELALVNRGLESEELEEAKDIAGRIRKNQVIPDYMKKNVSMYGKFKFINRKYFFKLKLFLNYIKGDKYNIPAPITAIKEKRKARKELKRWILKEDKTNALNTKKKILLYPLQMQPEFNLDVWGRNFRQQDRLILQIKRNLPSDWILAIKTNPKSFLELSEEVNSIEDVIRIPHSSSMAEVLPKIDAVVTVTGTVAIECAVKRIPVFVLSEGYLSKLPGSINIENLQKLSNINNLIANYKACDIPEKILCHILANSYQGTIGESITNPLALGEDNIQSLYAGFVDFIFNYEKK